MYTFKAIIQKFASKAEKTGWTYVDIPPDIIFKLKLKNKKEFRIKGLADDVKFERLATYPVGEGNFIIAINGDMRKKLGKKEGAIVIIKFEIDTNGVAVSEDLMDCLKEDTKALKQFISLTLSHQNYFHKYIVSAKTPPTKAARIVQTIKAMHSKQNFGEMLREQKALRANKN